MSRPPQAANVAGPPRRSRVATVVRVTTLGGFDIRVNGKPLALGRKTPAKPLALLKFLAACGHRGAADATVAAALWPDKGASAAACLAVNLHRLRRLLGASEAVIHRDRQLMLDRHFVLCDAILCEDLLDRAAHCMQGALHMKLTTRAVALYRGDFLAGEVSAGWVGNARERLRARHALACAALAERLAAADRWDEARSLFERAARNRAAHGLESVPNL